MDETLRRDNQSFANKRATGLNHCRSVRLVQPVDQMIFVVSYDLMRELARGIQCLGCPIHGWIRRFR